MPHTGQFSYSLDSGLTSAQQLHYPEMACKVEIHESSQNPLCNRVTSPYIVQHQAQLLIESGQLDTLCLLVVVLTALHVKHVTWRRVIKKVILLQARRGQGQLTGRFFKIVLLETLTTRGDKTVSLSLVTFALL